MDTEALAVCARLVESVAKGTDAHLYLSAEYMVRAAGKFGQDHEEFKQVRFEFNCALLPQRGAQGQRGRQVWPRTREIQTGEVKGRLAAEGRYRWRVGSRRQGESIVL